MRSIRLIMLAAALGVAALVPAPGLEAAMPEPLTCPACSSSRECMQLGIQTYEHKQRQQMEKAADCLEKAVELDPENARAYAYLTLVYREQMVNAWYRWNANVPQAKIIKDIKEKGMDIAVIYVTPQIDQIIMAADRALALAPDSAEALYAKSVTEVMRDNLAAARQYVDRAVEARPGWSLAWMQSARIHELNYEYDNAIKHYRKATELDPNNAAAHSNLGRLFRRLSDYSFEDAEREYLAALAINPNYPAALVNYGMLLLDRRDRRDESCGYFIEALDLAAEGYGFLGQQYSLGPQFREFCGMSVKQPVFDSADSELLHELGISP